jgi:hypothetical protein
MKTILFLLLFFSISFSGFAQYGKLEPLKEGDSTFVVLRTPKETLKKFSESPDKNERKLGLQIESVERQLETLRSIYLSNRIQSPDMQIFINNIKSLESKGVNVNYYVQEMLIYSPKNGL